MTRIRTDALFGACVALWACGPMIAAEEVFKSVDAQGNITYSGTPPPADSGARVQTLEIGPGPTPGDQDSAHARMREFEQAEQERDNADAAARALRTQQISAAQQAVIRAKAELEQAKIQGDNDWQYLATGGRVLSQSYFNRVTEAESRVQVAEKALQQARQGR